MEWVETTDRYVAFFDILGFKNLVFSEDHNTVLKKLNIINQATEKMMDPTLKFTNENNLAKDLSKVYKFSDSIIFISKSNSYDDFAKIIHDSYRFLQTSFENEIPIKGVISYGKITISEDNSMIFGKPIIDAYLLQDELHILSVVIDNYAEVEYAKFKNDNLQIKKVIFDEKVSFKSGKIRHKVIKPLGKVKEVCQERLKIMRLSCSGKTRLYYDNTEIFFQNYEII